MKSEAPNVDILFSESFKSVQNAIVNFFSSHISAGLTSNPLSHMGVIPGKFFS